VNIFKNNRFKKIFAKNVGVYSLWPEDFSDIRFLMEGNSYSNIFGNDASVLSMIVKNNIGDQTTVKDYLKRNPQSIGIIKMK